MSIIKVALLQMAACGNDQHANVEKGEAFCRRARDMGADIALFPEMWNTGYTSAFELPGDGNVYCAPDHWNDAESGDSAAMERARESWQAQAVGRQSPFVSHFQALARELKMAIAITYLEAWPGGPRNSVSLIDRHGDIALTYAKVHTCDFDLPEAWCTPGDDFYVCPLDTAQGGVNVGAMICFDREIPESARILMLEGAELILVPNACDLEENRISQFRARGFENMVGVAMTNYAAPQNNGHSIAFDGIAFDRDGNSRSMLLVEADEREGVFIAEFDLDQLRAYRKREVWGNAFRRPHRYGLLTSLEVNEPFIRVSASGEAYRCEQR